MTSKIWEAKSICKLFGAQARCHTQIQRWRIKPLFEVVGEGFFKIQTVKPAEGGFRYFRRGLDAQSRDAIHSPFPRSGMYGNGRNSIPY